MTNKLFALASVSALAGLMTTVAAAGCSSTTETVTQNDAGVADAKTDTGARRDASGPDEEDAGDEACPKDVAITAKDLDDEIGFKAAKATPGACTQEELTTIESNSKKSGLKSYFELGEGLTEGCKACAFSKDTDANWQPIVGTAENNGETGFFNYGACFSTDGDACGKAVQYSEFCTNVACNECATTQTEMSACAKAADDGMCKAFGEAIGTDCPNLQATAQKCGNSVLTAIKALCVGTADAGQ